MIDTVLVHEIGDHVEHSSSGCDDRGEQQHYVEVGQEIGGTVAVGADTSRNEVAAG